MDRLSYSHSERGEVFEYLPNRGSLRMTLVKQKGPSMSHPSSLKPSPRVFKNSILGSLTLLLLALGIFGCRHHQDTIPPEIARILGLEIDRPLEVVFFSPQGETETIEQSDAITVVFNQPMKELTATSSDLRRPFEIQPEVVGRFRWKGAATVSFEPAHPLPFGTEYTITVPAGLNAPNGATLKESKTFTFSTPAPRLLRSLPVNGNAEWPGGTPRMLSFNQAVAPEVLQPQLRILDQGGQAVDFSVRAAQDSDAEIWKRLDQFSPTGSASFEADRTLVVETQELLPATRYTLTIAPGLEGLQGPVSSSKETTVTFTSLGPLKLKPNPDLTQAREPSRSVPIGFTTRVNLAKLKEHLSVSPAVEIPTNSYDQYDDTYEHHFYLDLKPNSRYTFKIDPELTDIFGQTLGQETTFVLNTGDRATGLHVADGVGVLEAKGKRSLPVGLMNVDELTYRLAKVDRAQVARMLNDSSGTWLWGSDPYVPPGGFGETKALRPESKKNELSDWQLDLDQVLGASKQGYVYYQIEAKRGAQSTQRRGLVQVTNLAATAKFSSEKILITATSLDQAALLKGVKVTVTDRQGRPLWSGVTGDDGCVEAPGWSALLPASSDNIWGAKLNIFLDKDGDETYVEYRGYGTAGLWEFDIPIRWSDSAHDFTASIYSERGLYRPGDEVQLKGAVRDRQNGSWIIPDFKIINFEVINSRDEKLTQGMVELTDFGTFNHSVSLPPNAPTGTYRVDYSLSPEVAKSNSTDERLSGRTFRVEDFQPAQFEVKVTSETPNPVLGSEVSFEAEATWLFGAPMAEHSLEWEARLEPATYENPDFPGYDFGPSPSFEEEDRDTTLKLGSAVDARTDSSGRFAHSLALEGVPFKGDAKLLVDATVTSESRRSITGTLDIPVSRGEFRIGAKPSTRFHQGQKPIEIDLVTLTASGNALSGQKLQADLVRRQWNSVRKTDVDGRFRWTSEVIDEIEKSETLSSRKGEQKLSFTPDNAGLYLVRISGTDNRGNEIITETSFYATGSSYVAWQRNENQSFNLVADKPTYQPGETAKLLIQSPFEKATALITYERDTILYSTTATLEGSAPVLEVPITSEHLPNLYVSVMLFRGRIEPETPDPVEDVGKPAFAMGYVNLPVSPEEKRLKIALTTDRQEYGPGDEVTVTIKATDHQNKPVLADLSLAAVDLGVLNLIAYQTPDLFDDFYGTMPLAVRSNDSRTHVIGQRSYGTKGENQGGGGGYHPGFRSDFRLTALWEPRVLTDSAGTAEVKFTLPDNLSTFRVMATGLTKDTSCGSAELEILSSKPLVLVQSGANFARLGDEFEVGVTVANRSDKDRTAKVALEVEGLSMGSPPAQDVFIKAGQEREVLFSLKADPETDKDGLVSLRYSADMGEYSDHLQLKLPLKTPTQRVHLAHSGSTIEQNLTVGIEVPGSALPGSATLEMNLSSTILNGLGASLQDLIDFPYQCLEQRLSRIEPLLAHADLAQHLGLDEQTPVESRSMVQSNLDQIASYQADDGGLKVWPGSQSVHPYLTARAFSLAHQAKDRGYTVPDAWTSSARAYLKKVLDNQAPAGLPLNEVEQRVVKAAALEALSRSNFPGTPYLNSMLDQREGLPVLGRAYLLQAAHRLKAQDAVKLLTQELNNSLKMENATAYFEAPSSALPWLYSDSVRDTAVAFEALLLSEQAPPNASAIATWLLEARNQRGVWNSTASNAAALTALAAYGQKFEGQPGDLTVEVSLGTEPLLKADLAGAEVFKQSTTTELQIPTKTDVALRKSGEGRLYYNVSVSYRDTEPSPPVDEGMTVLRAITDLDGKATNRLRGGEVYRVQLSVIAPAERRFVVLEDPLPAGLVAVQTDFATESQKLRDLLKMGQSTHPMTFDHFEIAGDRILLCADALSPGEHLYEYLVRADAPGTYIHPATQAEEMYHPEVFGRTGVTQVQIRP